MIWLFGALVLLPLAVNFAATRISYERHIDAFMLAAMICVFWAFTNTIAMVWEWPESKRFHSLVDLIGLATCVASYIGKPHKWKAYLAMLFFLQICAHAAFWWAYDGVTTGRIAYAYALTLNLSWLAQLLCVGASGGIAVLGYALDRLRRRGGGGHLGRA